VELGAGAVQPDARTEGFLAACQLLRCGQGGYRQYKHHAVGTDRVTITGRSSMDLDPKAQNSNLKQADLR